jgi:hypothetical protein
MLQEQQMPPLVPNELEEEEEDSEEEPEEIEGMSEIDSEHGDPEPNPHPIILLPAASLLWAILTISNPSFSSIS